MYNVYDTVSDVVESNVQFASKILTPKHDGLILLQDISF